MKCVSFQDTLTLRLSLSLKVYRILLWSYYCYSCYYCLNIWTKDNIMLIYWVLLNNLFKAKLVLAQFSSDRINDRIIKSIWFMHSLATYLNYGLKHLWFNVKTLMWFSFAKCHITAMSYSNSDAVVFSCSS